jgi:hypothetical protein
MTNEEKISIIAKARLLDLYLDMSAANKYGVVGNLTMERQIPAALLEHKKKHGVRAGFTFGCIFTDRRLKKCYVAVLQDGTFWPMDASKEDGMGAYDRNCWAAKFHQQKFEEFCRAPVDKTP